MTAPDLRVIVTGSYDWCEEDGVVATLDACLLPYGERLLVVHPGRTHGAEVTLAAWCRARGVREELHRSNFRALGHAAPYERNEEMVASGAALVLAFITGPPDRTPVETDIVTQAARRGSPVLRGVDPAAVTGITRPTEQARRSRPCH